MVLPHASKINETGRGVNRYFYSNPESIRAGDLNKHAVLKASALVVGDESSDGIVDIQTDHGDDQRRFINHAPVGSPAAGSLDDRVTLWEILTGGDEGEGSALVDGQLGRFKTDGDGVGGGGAHWMVPVGGWGCLPHVSKISDRSGHA